MPQTWLWGNQALMKCTCILAYSQTWYLGEKFGSVSGKRSIIEELWFEQSRIKAKNNTRLRKENKENDFYYRYKEELQDYVEYWYNIYSKTSVKLVTSKVNIEEITGWSNWGGHFVYSWHYLLDD